MSDTWKAHGECAKPGHNPEWWWAEESDPTTDTALHLCWQCPVRQACLKHALNYPERLGIWGGLLPYERLRLRALNRRQEAC